MIMAHCRSDEIAKFVRSCLQILQIEHAFGKSAKKSRHSVLQNFSTRAKQRSIGIQFASERDEIALVSARAVQEQERSVRISVNEFVKKIRLRPHCLSGTWIAGRIFSICERTDSS